MKQSSLEKRNQQILGMAGARNTLHEFRAHRRKDLKNPNLSPEKYRKLKREIDGYTERIARYTIQLSSARARLRELQNRVQWIRQVDYWVGLFLELPGRTLRNTAGNRDPLLLMARSFLCYTLLRVLNMDGGLVSEYLGFNRRDTAANVARVFSFRATKKEQELYGKWIAAFHQGMRWIEWEQKRAQSKTTNNEDRKSNSRNRPGKCRSRGRHAKILILQPFLPVLSKSLGEGPTSGRHEPPSRQAI